MKRALVRWWMVVCSVMITLYYCLLALIAAFRSGTQRPRVDRYLRAWAKRLLAVIKLDYRVYNPHQVKFEPGKKYIVMCNHSSLYDIPLSTVAIDGSMRMVAKKELCYIPLFGYALKKSEFIFIDRKRPQQAEKALQFAATKMQEGIMIWLAPEGTRSATGQLLPFKKGGFRLALQTGATIIPLGIRGVRNIIAHKTFQINRHQRAQVHIGKPIDVTRYRLSQRRQLMTDVAVAIKEAAGLP